MVNVDALKGELATVEAELDGLGARRKALEKAASDLRAAIDSVAALEGKGGRTGRRRTAAKSAKPRASRPTVTPDDLTSAIGDLGGEATVEQLVEKLGLPDGRSLNGARRVAVEAGTVAYEDRTYRLVS